MPKVNIGGTGGAVPVKNEKGEITMQKVKVQRYVAGKRPNYAPESDDEEDYVQDDDINSEDEEEDLEEERRRRRISSQIVSVDDRRLKRLESSMTEETTVSKSRRGQREIAEPVLLSEKEQESAGRHREKINLEIFDDDVKDNEDKLDDEDDDGKEKEIDEEERMRRRMELKKKALQRQQELMEHQEKRSDGSRDDDEDSSDSDEDESDEFEEEEEEYTESEEDEIEPRLKPVFVRKKDRVTIQEKETEEEHQRELEEAKKLAQAESKKQTKKLIEEVVSKEKLAEKENDDNIVCEFDTDDEKMDESDYEAWKLRELRRIKRDRDEKEAAEKEKQEIEKLRAMTEEERLAYLKANPKTITNAVDKKKKQKYKFLQKYYHRGAFFMDKEEDIYKRNYAEPTLEDNFNKSILPKVMQVKNFGMSGRTKYTHLTDQDTTKAAMKVKEGDGAALIIDDNPWTMNDKYVMGGGGTKQVFEKPTFKKRK